MIETPPSPAAPSHEPAFAQSAVPDLCHDSTLPAGRRARLGAHVCGRRLAGPARAAAHQSCVFHRLYGPGATSGMESVG